MPDHIPFVDNDTSQANRVTAEWLNDINDAAYGPYPTGTLGNALASTASASGEGSDTVGQVHTTGYLGTTVHDKLAAHLVYLDDFFITGDADWYAASRRAAIYCAATGATLRLLPKTYAGARLEVHKTFSIEGGGATVDYLGIGNTLIAGTGSGTGAVPTAWAASDTDAMADLYPVTMYTPSGSSAIGDNAMSFTSVAGVSIGDYLFIAENPTSSSSVNNYIPKDFEYARIKSIVSTTVTFEGKLNNAYTTAAAAFQCDGIAVGCTISNLRISTDVDAYQHVIRSALNVTLSNIEFAGESSIGGATFSENLRWSGINVVGAYGPISTARGTVSADIDGFSWKPRTNTPTAEALAIFIEESLYRVSCRNLKIDGGCISFGSLDMAGGQGKRLVTIDSFTVDTTNAVGGASNPLKGATASGADFVFRDGTFSGTAVTPNASNYPGITGLCLTHFSSNAAADKVKFNSVHFKSTNAEPVFPIAVGGLLGSVLFDEMCTYEIITPPITRWTPRGYWNDMTSGLLNGFTVSASSVAQYRIQDKTVYLKGRLDLNGAVAGTNFFAFPAGARPLTEAKFVVANNANTVVSTTRVNAAGDAFYVNSGGAITYIQLDQMSFPIDV